MTHKMLSQPLYNYAKQKAFNYTADKTMAYLRGSVAKYRKKPITRYSNTEHRLLRLETNQRARKPTLKHKTFAFDGSITAISSFLKHITFIDEGTNEDERIGRHIRIRSILWQGYADHRLDARLCLSKTVDNPQYTDLEGGELGRQWASPEFKDLAHQIVGVVPNAVFTLRRYWKTGYPVSYFGTSGSDVLENSMYCFLTNARPLGDTTTLNSTVTVYYSDN